ncbi:MAG: hypothetical protein O3A47_09760 [Chloroflexi bacterium]|nr:hypothetical protein [Chloroflexota bacterium]
MTSSRLQMGEPFIEQQLREDYGLDKPLVVQYLKSETTIALTEDTASQRLAMGNSG